VKKILIGVGLAALLSSCLDTGLISVFSDDIGFKSNYIRTTQSKTEQVLCFNKSDNVVELSFSFNGRTSDFASFRAKIFGTKTSQFDFLSNVFKVVSVPQNPPAIDEVVPVGKRISVAFGFPANQVPYNAPNLVPQAVVVNPNPTPVPTATFIGSADLQLTITDSRGASATSSILVKAIPVYNNCP
jgi:hypothetical protein